MDTPKRKKENKQNNRQPINVLANPEIQKGVYSNVAMIQHTKNEFVLDFLLNIGGNGQLVSRVILSPNHMKALQKAINQNIEKYVKEYEPDRVSNKDSE